MHLEIYVRISYAILTKTSHTYYLITILSLDSDINDRAQFIKFTIDTKIQKFI